jgi:dienelactone hydrolase
MYGRRKSTTHPEQAREWSQKIRQNLELWQARALKGLQVLKKQKLADETRVAAIGYCFGGATVQQLAYASADIRGIVSFHGSLISPPEGAGDRVRAKFLICHGAADPFVKKEKIPLYFSAMNDSGIDWQFLALDGAKHSFTNPDADQVGIKGLQYDQIADRRSWDAMTMFFEELFNSH